MTKIPSLSPLKTSTKIAQFLHRTIDGLGEKRIKWEEFNGIENFDPIIISKSYQKLIEQIGVQTEKEKVLEYLKKYRVEEAIHEVMCECILARAEDIKSFLQAQTTKISQASLKDFDWKLKMAISSDKLSTIRDPLLLLDLSLHNHKENQEVMIELNKNDVDHLVETLEKIQEALVDLKV